MVSSALASASVSPAMEDRSEVLEGTARTMPDPCVFCAQREAFSIQGGLSQSKKKSSSPQLGMHLSSTHLDLHVSEYTCDITYSFGDRGACVAIALGSCALQRRNVLKKNSKE